VPGKHYAGEAAGGIEITKFYSYSYTVVIIVVLVVGTTILYDSSYTTTNAAAAVLLLLVVGLAKQRQTTDV